MKMSVPLAVRHGAVEPVMPASSVDRAGLDASTVITGASLVPVMVMVTVCVDLPPLLS